MPTPVQGSAWVGSSVIDPAIVKALAAKAATMTLKKSLKEDCLHKEVESMARKKLHQTHNL